MKTALILSLMFVSSAHAAVQVVFSSDKAVLLVQGPAGDKDAQNLFNTMMVPPVDSATALEKHIAFTNSASQSIFDLSCKVAKNIADYGSCTLQIFKNGAMVFDPSTQTVMASFQNAADVAKVSQLFSPPDHDGNVYYTADLTLGMHVLYNHGPTPAVFMIEYSKNRP